MFPLSTMLTSFVKVGSLTVHDAEGRTHVFGRGVAGPAVTMKLTDPTLYRALFFNPELHAGEAYMDGRMSFPGSSLRDFLTLFSMNRLSLGNQPHQKVLRGISRRLKRFQQANPLGKARENVAHHYDLGNAFYEMFLDREMFYSCAYFRNETETLEEAQRNKCRLIAAKLDLKPGQKVLDIGSGWGGSPAISPRLPTSRSRASPYPKSSTPWRWPARKPLACPIASGSSSRTTAS
jgi:cyclopropane-fatty-acyl-phospholipid synthase